MFRFCITINIIFFLFGFLIIGTNTVITEQISISGDSIELQFDFDNILVTIVAVIITIALIGLNVLGSGLQDSSVKIIYKILTFSLLWSITSIFSIEIISLIPLGVGSIIYTILTIMYIISFLISGVDSEE